MSVPNGMYFPQGFLYYFLDVSWCTTWKQQFPCQCETGMKIWKTNTKIGKVISLSLYWLENTTVLKAIGTKKFLFVHPFPYGLFCRQGTSRMSGLELYPCQTTNTGKCILTVKKIILYSHKINFCASNVPSNLLDGREIEVYSP